MESIFDNLLSIRTTQLRSFGGKRIGTDSTCGLSFPSTEKIAAAYELPYIKISRLAQFPKAMETLLHAPGPVICEVISIRDQAIIPGLVTKKSEDGKFSSSPMEDMFPFLPRETFLKEMIIEPLKISLEEK